MDDSNSIQHIIEHGVLRVEGGAVTMTPSFQRTYDEALSDITSTNSLPSIELSLDRCPITMEEILERDPSFVASFYALQQYTSLSQTELIRLVPVIDQLEQQSTVPDEVPDGFLGVTGDRMVVLVRLYHQTIVYLWREDCPPCDAMKAALETATIPDSVACLAVYGPDCPSLLRDNFDAVVAPTTLYTLDGFVESRHVGPRSVRTIERELDELTVSAE